MESIGNGSGWADELSWWADVSRTGMTPVGKQCDEATKVEFLLNKDEANRWSAA